VGEGVFSLDDQGELKIWFNRERGESNDPDVEEALAYLLDEARLLIRSAQMRDSIANFDLG
jgi:hypothetical protein